MKPDISQCYQVFTTCIWEGEALWVSCMMFSMNIIKS